MLPVLTDGSVALQNDAMLELVTIASFGKLRFFLTRMPKTIPMWTSRSESRASRATSAHSRTSRRDSAPNTSLRQSLVQSLMTASRALLALLPSCLRSFREIGEAMHAVMFHVPSGTFVRCGAGLFSHGMTGAHALAGWTPTRATRSMFLSLACQTMFRKNNTSRRCLNS